MVLAYLVFWFLSRFLGFESSLRTISLGTLDTKYDQEVGLHKEHPTMNVENNSNSNKFK